MLAEQDAMMRAAAAGGGAGGDPFAKPRGI